MLFFMFDVVVKTVVTLVLRNRSLTIETYEFVEELGFTSHLYDYEPLKVLLTDFIIFQILLDNDFFL